MYLPFSFEAKLTVLKEKEKNTRKHTATKQMKEHSVSGMTKDVFEGHLADWIQRFSQRLISFVDATRIQSV